MTARDAFAYLNRIAGIAPLRAPAFAGDDPIMPTPFRAAQASAASVGLAASAANEIWRLRGGRQQEIAVDLNVAASSLALVRASAPRGKRGSEAGRDQPHGRLLSGRRRALDSSAWRLPFSCRAHARSPECRQFARIHRGLRLALERAGARRRDRLHETERRDGADRGGVASDGARRVAREDAHPSCSRKSATRLCCVWANRSNRWATCACSI